MALSYVKKFLKLESAGGIVLFLAALMAMIWANSPFAYLHQHFITRFLPLINDGLMTFFFLLVGFELKRGYLLGELSSLKQVILPLGAALGGMLIPALIYCAINYPHFRGWSTPVATDIAFALGVLSLFGSRIPLSLKLFLLSLAIFDDVGSIIIIAFFYSSHISIFYIACSLVFVIILFTLNHDHDTQLIAYLTLGVLLWVATLLSGIHPTLAGVLLGLAIPPRLLTKMESKLHPWVVFCIMPLFALANAGFSFNEVMKPILESKIVVGIMLGLFIGKQAGVFIFSWIMIKTKISRLPDKSSWIQLYAVSVLCGIGFTLSLFLGTLSFANETNYLSEVRMGVLLGSLLSGLLGAMVILKGIRH